MAEKEKRKIPRLGKAAGEFNVSIQSAVDLLKKKNFDIENNPNAKLTEEMYDVLIKEFQVFKDSKEEAQKINIGVYNKKNEDTSSSKTAQEVPQAQPTPEPEVSAVKEKEEIVEKQEEVIKAEIPTPKILGTIDLNQFNKTKKASTPTEEIKEETQEPTPEEPITQPEVEPAQEVVAVAVDVEPEIPQEEQPSSNIEEEVTPEPVELSKEDELKEHFGIKVTGKIDLDNLNKKKSAPVQPKEEPIVTEEIKKEETDIEEKTTTETEPEKDPNFIETVYTKIQAPVVKGKIDLDSFKSKETPKKEKEQPVKKENNSENEEKKKRKRTRIKHPANKPSGENNKKEKAQPAPKAEISQEDIQRHIKETMMRLEPLGKSKTSKRKREKRQHIQEEMRENELQAQQDQKKLKVTEFLTANELATLMNLPVVTIISTCMSIGLAVSINQRLDAETISLLADEFGYEVEFVKADIEEELAINTDDNEEDLEPRHPIITVMGHVDHGKTSLLDYIRKSNVIAGEAGGITQHIGAYEVTMQDGRKITFLDTPGHEAFTAMRARGAKVTDVCIIVIAADDAVMPQTVEAIHHSQAAGVSMVFAITKIDKATANPDKIREELAAMNILVEEWGGKYQCQEIDAKHGVNVEELLEKVLLEAELLELKANPKKNGVGTVLESSLDKGKGYVAKVLVQNGTIKVGDPVLAGTHYGKVKALYNERNQQVQSAGPATPILLLGLSGAPQAGDIINVCHSDHEARVAATKRAQLAREMGLRTQKHITLDEIGRRIAIGDFKELNIIVKGDVDGSVEALSDSLLKLSTPQVQVNVIHKSVGQVTESDVLLASASNAVIVAFQVRPSAGSRKLAEQEQIDIRTYSIIYTAINEIKDAIAGMHSPEIREKVLCNIEIREVYKISKVGNVAGCMVLDGKLQRNTKVRVIRDGIVVYTGKLGSLRRFKDDVKEVVAGQDCGLNIENFNDIKVGDIVEGYEEYEVKVTL